MLTAEDLTSIRQIVREEVAGKIDRPDKKTELPVREYTQEECETLAAAFSPEPGNADLTPDRAAAFLLYRNVAEATEYLNSALSKFGVDRISLLPDSVQSGSLGSYVRYAGPFPFGWADIPKLPGDVEGAGV